MPTASAHLSPLEAEARALGSGARTRALAARVSACVTLSRSSDVAPSHVLAALLGGAVTLRPVGSGDGSGLSATVDGVGEGSGVPPASPAASILLAGGCYWTPPGVGLLLHGGDLPAPLPSAPSGPTSSAATVAGDGASAAAACTGPILGDWVRGFDATILLVGQRGTGKSSLAWGSPALARPCLALSAVRAGLHRARRAAWAPPRRVVSGRNASTRVGSALPAAAGAAGGSDAVAAPMESGRLLLSMWATDERGRVHVDLLAPPSAPHPPHATLLPALAAQHVQGTLVTVAVASEGEAAAVIAMGLAASGNYVRLMDAAAAADASSGTVAAAGGCLPPPLWSHRGSSTQLPCPSRCHVSLALTLEQSCAGDLVPWPENRANARVALGSSAHAIPLRSTLTIIDAAGSCTAGGRSSPLLRLRGVELANAAAAAVTGGEGGIGATKGSIWAEGDAPSFSRHYDGLAHLFSDVADAQSGQRRAPPLPMPPPLPVSVPSTTTAAGLVAAQALAAGRKGMRTPRVLFRVDRADNAADGPGLRVSTRPGGVVASVHASTTPAAYRASSVGARVGIAISSAAAVASGMAGASPSSSGGVYEGGLAQQLAPLLWRGGALFCLIACVSGDACDALESRNTLALAASASRIILRAVRGDVLAVAGYESHHGDGGKGMNVWEWSAWTHAMAPPPVSKAVTTTIAAAAAPASSAPHSPRATPARPIVTQEQPESPIGRGGRSLSPVRRVAPASPLRSPLRSPPRRRHEEASPPPGGAVERWVQLLEEKEESELQRRRSGSPPHRRVAVGDTIPISQAAPTPSPQRRPLSPLRGQAPSSFHSALAPPPPQQSLPMRASAPPFLPWPPLPPPPAAPVRPPILGTGTSTSMHAVAVAPSHPPHPPPSSYVATPPPYSLAPQRPAASLTAFGRAFQATLLARQSVPTLQSQPTSLLLGAPLLHLQPQPSQEVASLPTSLDALYTRLALQPPPPVPKARVVEEQQQRVMMTAAGGVGTTPAPEPSALLTIPTSFSKTTSFLPFAASPHPAIAAIVSKSDVGAQTQSPPLMRSSSTDPLSPTRTRDIAAPSAPAAASTAAVPAAAVPAAAAVHHHHYHPHACCPLGLLPGGCTLPHHHPPGGGGDGPSGGGAGGGGGGGGGQPTARGRSNGDNSSSRNSGGGGSSAQGSSDAPPPQGGGGGGADRSGGTQSRLAHGPSISNAAPAIEMAAVSLLSTGLPQLLPSVSQGLLVAPPLSPVPPAPCSPPPPHASPSVVLHPRPSPPLTESAVIEEKATLPPREERVRRASASSTASRASSAHTRARAIMSYASSSSSSSSGGEADSQRVVAPAAPLPPPFPARVALEAAARRRRRGSSAPPAQGVAAPPPLQSRRRGTAPLALHAVRHRSRSISGRVEAPLTSSRTIRSTATVMSEAGVLVSSVDAMWEGMTRLVTPITPALLETFRREHLSDVSGSSSSSSGGSGGKMKSARGGGGGDVSGSSGSGSGGSLSSPELLGLKAGRASRLRMLEHSPDSPTVVGGGTAAAAAASVDLSGGVAIDLSSSPLTSPRGFNALHLSDEEGEERHNVHTVGVDASGNMMHVAHPPLHCIPPPINAAVARVGEADAAVLLPSRGDFEAGVTAASPSQRAAFPPVILRPVAGGTAAGAVVVRLPSPSHAQRPPSMRVTTPPRVVSPQQQRIASPAPRSTSPPHVSVIPRARGGVSPTHMSNTPPPASVRQQRRQSPPHRTDVACGMTPPPSVTKSSQPLLPPLPALSHPLFTTSIATGADGTSETVASEEALRNSTLLGGGGSSTRSSTQLSRRVGSSPAAPLTRLESPHRTSPPRQHRPSSSPRATPSSTHRGTTAPSSPADAVAALKHSSSQLRALFPSAADVLLTYETALSAHEAEVGLSRQRVCVLEGAVGDMAHRLSALVSSMEGLVLTASSVEEERVMGHARAVAAAEAQLAHTRSLGLLAASMHRAYSPSPPHRVQVQAPRGGEQMLSPTLPHASSHLAVMGGTRASRGSRTTPASPPRGRPLTRSSMHGGGGPDAAPPLLPSARFLPGGAPPILPSASLQERLAPAPFFIPLQRSVPVPISNVAPAASHDAIADAVGTTEVPPPRRDKARSESCPPRGVGATAAAAKVAAATVTVEEDVSFTRPSLEPAILRLVAEHARGYISTLRRSLSQPPAPHDNKRSSSRSMMTSTPGASTVRRGRGALDPVTQLLQRGGVSHGSPPGEPRALSHSPPIHHAQTLPAWRPWGSGKSAVGTQRVGLVASPPHDPLMHHGPLPHGSPGEGGGDDPLSPGGGSGAAGIDRTALSALVNEASSLLACGLGLLKGQVTRHRSEAATLKAQLQSAQGELRRAGLYKRSADAAHKKLAARGRGAATLPSGGVGGGVGSKRELLFFASVPPPLPSFGGAL